MKMHSTLILALAPLSSSASILRASRTTGEDESTFIRRIMFGSTTTRATAELRVCPSSISNNYQSLPGVTPCTTNADCADFFSGDGPTCCVHPQCICGVMDLGASTNVGCVDDSTSSTDDVIRTDDDLISSPPIDIGLPTPPSPTSTPVLPTLITTPQPTVQVAITPAPTPLPTLFTPTASTKVCPTSISKWFQELDDVIPCETNADCANYVDSSGTGGPSCCLHPICVCGFDPGSTDPELSCVDDFVPNDDVTRSDDVLSPPIDIGGGPTPPLPPTPDPTPEPTLPPSPVNTCPSPQAPTYQAFPDVTPCTTNADCANFISIDGPTCCVYPYCICGVQNLGASNLVQCVAT